MRVSADRGRKRGARIELVSTKRNADVQLLPQKQTKPDPDASSADERAGRTSEKIKALSLVERQQFATEYMAQGGKGNTFQHDIGTLKRHWKDRIHFMASSKNSGESRLSVFGSTLLIE
jgi:hypothetical protein